jgi:N-acetylglutamate synthase-like GNAT family acetyltransferase
MTSPALLVRRATVDDLPALRALWQMARLPAEELENRLTEFLVVESGGQFAGALGVQVVRQHARVHSEDYTDFSVADAARELIWERIQKLAANLGVFRVWTQENSPFWTRGGFQVADAELLKRLPDEWKNLEGRWLTLELKDEDAINEVMKTQIAGFRESEKEATDRVADQARVLRSILVVVLFAFAAVCFVIAGFLIMRRMHAQG